jgi:hypothetical protein
MEKIMVTYYMIDGILHYNHGHSIGQTASPIYKKHVKGHNREKMTLEDLYVGKKSIYGAMPEGVWDVDGYNTRYGYQPRKKKYVEGEPLRNGQYFYTDQDEDFWGGYAAISEILNIDVLNVYVPSNFIWGEKGYKFVPWGAKERIATSTKAEYEVELKKVIVTLALHGRAKYELITNITPNSIEITRVYEPL